MIAADSSSLIAYLAGESGADAAAVERALTSKALCLPPVVVTEMLGDPSHQADVEDWLLDVPLLPVIDGYWRRAGSLRAAVRARGLKARTIDALICQSCLDHRVALITRDSDFRHFARHCGLRLA